MMGKDQIEGIAKDLEAIVTGQYYYCPKCGTFGDWHDATTENAEDYENVECPECGNPDLSDMDITDYFDDGAIYGLEYRVDSKYAENINSVRVCVAYGGPNIYIDTGDMKVKCAWWFDYSEVRADVSAFLRCYVDDFASDFVCQLGQRFGRKFF